MATRNVSKVELADCPEDGGKWIIYCEHFDDNGECIYTAILQDSNKRRLNSWRTGTFVWCEKCQEDFENELAGSK